MEENEYNRECLADTDGDPPTMKAADDTKTVTNMNTTSEFQESDASEVSDKVGLEVKHDSV